MEELRSLADLLDLQEVDLQIDRLLHDRQSLPELEEYRLAHGHHEALATDLAAAEQVLRDTSLQLDKTEGRARDQCRASRCRTESTLRRRDERS